MISFLEGRLEHKGATSVVLAVGGVGYDVSVPTSVVSRLPAVGKSARVHTRMVVRDDSITLYGFSTTDERQLFDLLTGVTGVGPKVGLSFLSAMSADSLRRAVISGDADALTVVPGVGKKVAQRVVVDLRDRLGGEAELPGEAGPIVDEPDCPGAYVARPARGGHLLHVRRDPSVRHNRPSLAHLPSGGAPAAP